MWTKRSVLAGFVALSTFAPAQSFAAMKSLTIGTNPSGSVFFLIGSGFAKLFQEKLSIRSTAQPNGGSSVYIPLVNSGEMTLGISSTIDARLAYEGQGFPAKMSNLRAIANVWVIPYGYITRANTGIKTVEDLKGKRVMGDMPTNVSLTALNKVILETAGLSTKDVDFARSGGLIDGINAVVQGRADAAPVATSMPVLVQENSTVPGGLQLVANGKLATNEFYSSHLAGTRVLDAKPDPKRPFISKNTPIVAYDTLLLTSAGVSDDDVYKLTKAIYENWDQLQKDYPPLRSVAKTDLASSSFTVPMHPGAIRFYKEVGEWSKEQEANEAKLK